MATVLESSRSIGELSSMEGVTFRFSSASIVGNLGAPVEEWAVGGTALTSLMDIERRHGPVPKLIMPALVSLSNFKTKSKSCTVALGVPGPSYLNTWSWGKFKHVIKKAMVELQGPIQFNGPASNNINLTLLLELGVQA
ncbi:hypothetical protein IFM89_009582 [Coptis chinensis]|uniref:Uncharacterized protein n=1 Tax=Coptis chinensis TaxID=261450 RepID=A0A835IKX4_9MAGN|nr:hypothetical protein IFM89_009582 [Coptis chinensis]